MKSKNYLEIKKQILNDNIDIAKRAKSDLQDALNKKSFSIKNKSIKFNPYNKISFSENQKSSKSILKR